MRKWLANHSQLTHIENPPLNNIHYNQTHYYAKELNVTVTDLALRLWRRERCVDSSRLLLLRLFPVTDVLRLELGQKSFPILRPQLRVLAQLVFDHQSLHRHGNAFVRQYSHIRGLSTKSYVKQSPDTSPLCYKSGGHFAWYLRQFSVP